MPDPTPPLEATTAAAFIAVLVVLLSGWPWRLPRMPWSSGGDDSLTDGSTSLSWARRLASIRASVGGLVGIVVGLSFACWFLDLLPKWPPLEDQHRLLLILLPAVLIVELLAALAGRFRWLLWLPRLLVAAAAGRVLLHGSIYILDPDEFGIRKWSSAETWQYLGAMAAALAGVWILLALLLRRAPGRSVPLVVVLTSFAAAIAVQLSGNATGGLIGLALAAALAGVLIASLFLATAPDMNGLLGVGVVGLFATLLGGYFFGDLTATNAVLIFFAPLLCWLPELPFLPKLGLWVRNSLRVALVLVPLSMALIFAGQKFVTDSTRTAPGSQEINYDDLYGK